MTYDVDTPPRSVELQRELEEIGAAIRAEITSKRLALVWLVALGGYALATAEPSSSETSAALEGVTLVDVGTWLAIAIAIGVLLVAIITIHELCHWLAFYHLGIPAWWSVHWLSVGGRNVYPFAFSGACGAKACAKQARMSWLESTFVSLAPLAFTAAVLAPVVAYHALVEPFSSLWWVVAGIVLITGPSPPDWRFVFQTPRERWEYLVELEGAFDRHAAAEGIDR